MEFYYTVAVLVSPGKRPPLSEMINFFPVFRRKQTDHTRKRRRKRKKRKRERD